MATKISKRSIAPPRRPERKWGPVHGGVSVAVWLNEVVTATGIRFFRSITLSPRRYIDEKTGNWENSSSLRATDLPALILGLEAAFLFVSSTPLPGLPADGEEQVDPIPQNGELAP